MNILYLTNELNHADGVSAHLYNLISELKNKFRINISIICGGGNATDKFKDTGSEVIVNRTINHSSRNLKNFASAIIYVYKFARSDKTDIIHSHNHYTSNIAYRSSKFSGTKTVQTVHGIIPEEGRLEHLSGDNFITVNDHIYRSIKPKLSNENKIELIYNGLEFRDEINIEINNKVKFLAASRLEPGKGLSTYIEAVSKLPVEYRNRAEFIIAGEGSLENELKILNNETGAGIIFPGMIRDMRKMYDEADVFVIPSESEGLPMSMLEAIASGSSIISSDFEGVESIITDGIDGTLFRMNDPVSLKEKLMAAIDNPDKLRIYSSALLKKAKVKFSISGMGLKHYNFYKRIIA